MCQLLGLRLIVRGLIPIWLFERVFCYNGLMNDIETKETLDDHLTPAGQPSTDPEYLAYKRAKVEKGLAEAEDRSKLTPAHKVWEALGLER